MKKNILLLLLFGVAGASTLFIQSCNKDTSDCKKCKTKLLTPNTTIEINQHLSSAYTDSNFNNLDPETILVTKHDDDSIKFRIQNLLSIIGLNNYNAENPIALNLYYHDSINTNNNDGLQGVLLYSIIDNQPYANFWKKVTNNSFVHMPKLSGISNIISKVDMYNINIVMGFSSKKMLLLLDETKIPKDAYHSVFQIKTNNEYEKNVAIGGGSGNISLLCNRNPDCIENFSGNCTYSEHQLGGYITAKCIPGFQEYEEVCPKAENDKMMVLNGYSTDDAETDELYKIRDLFLLNSVKGMQYVDDFYYTTKFIKNAISIQTALNVYELYKKNFFYKLSQFDNAQYNDSIIINNEHKQILLNICNSVSTVTNDSRYQSIITKIIGDINKYHNKSLLEIKNDFQ